MEDKKVLEIVDAHRQDFAIASFDKIKHPHDQLAPVSKSLLLAHCHSMLDGIVEFLTGGKEKRDRALIRLGFIQGCLWAIRYVTVGQLKILNRPDEGTVDELTHEPLTHEDLQDWEY